ncbi:MAG: hypothetical protein JWQ81_280, partial [Amycolatopsis sp.]|nr:hypothetical protein [Amycolatopsis sp.]
MPRPVRLNQLSLIKPNRRLRKRVIQSITNRTDRRINTQIDKMLSKPERSILTTRIRMMNQLIL